MIGIYDCFGYGDGYEVPFDERYKLIKDAGFDSVMLWWSDKFGRGNGYQEDVKFAWLKLIKYQFSIVYPRKKK